MSDALLVMDFQRVIVERFAERGTLALERANAALAHARSRGFLVIFVRVAFRPGAPEVAETNPGFFALSRAGGWDEDSPSTALHPSLDVRAGDLVTVKRRVSAFAGSDLDVILRAHRVDRLTLAGISTSGVVLSTLRAAADLDFTVTVLADACADADDEVHRVLIDKVFPRQAIVTTVDGWRDAPGT